MSPKDSIQIPFEGKNIEVNFPPLQAFFNNPAIKEKYVNQMVNHRKMDQLIHGIYWADGKGCAVGCITHSREHSQFETQLGLPEWLAHVVDYLFEGLKNGEAMTFPERVLQAIPLGANLDKTYHKFCKFVQTDIAKDADDKNVRKAIEGVLSQHDKAIKGEIISLPGIWRLYKAAWSAAESAAWSAAVSKMANKLIELLAEAEVVTA